MYQHIWSAVKALAAVKQGWVAIRLMRDDGTEVPLGYALEMLDSPQIGRQYRDCTGALVVELSH